MIWDASFESWSFYDVRGQPYAILLDASGNVVHEWAGAVPDAEVLQAIG